MVLHDLTFAELRGAEARTYLIVALIGMAFAGLLLAGLVALLVLRRWSHSVRQALDDLRAGRATGSDLANMPLGRELQKNTTDPIERSQSRFASATFGSL